MLKQFVIGAALFAGLGGASPARAQAPAAAPPAEAPKPNDYSDPKTWLCRPDLPESKNACNVDLTTTIVGADGKLARESWEPNPSAAIDCFYAYPTCRRTRPSTAT